MTFFKGSLEISIEQIDKFGKNPGLWIRSQTENAVVKVASFGSKKKADMFVDYLREFLGLKDGERGMEPEYTGFCRGCNCFSEHLKLRPVINHNTGSMEVSMFCDSCRERFGIFPYDKREMPDAKLKEGEKLKDSDRK